jgi:hypothetical protein
MAFAALTFVAELLLILFPGLVLHRALARRVLLLDAGEASHSVDEVELLGFGILPGLALANTVGTVLAIFHVFYWWSYLALMVVLVGWRWRDALATLLAAGAVVRLSVGSLLRGNLMVIVAVAIFLQTLAGMLVEAQLPSGNIDVWNHNFPLAQSIVANHGFIMPQIDNMFYGSYPIFFHMFFAEGLLLVDSVIAAKAANALLYLGFLVSLLAFAKHARAVAAVIVSVLVINSPFFSGGAADAMTDIGRVCFASLAFVFAYQYFRAGRLYFLFASGLLAGGAIAGKYTELLTPMLIGLSLLPALVSRKQGGWTAVVVFTAATAVTGAYPYLRNLILLHNPIYPFLFGHPGLSDAYMQGLQAEVFQSLDPVFRSYSQNLFSLRGWHDFASAAHEVFMSHWNRSYYLYGVILAGFLIMRSGALLVFALWTFGLWIFWYLVGNTNMRWGLTPFMLLLMMSYLAIVGSIDRCADAFAVPGPRWRRFTWGGAGEASRWTLPAWLTPIAVARIAVAIWALVICKDAIRGVKANGVSNAFPSWLNRDLARAVVQPDGFQAYLLRSQEGYQIYRYIGDHDLRKVLQPLDNGAGVYQTAYNDGRNGDWLIPWHSLPAKPADFDDYLSRNKIRYFVYRPALLPLNAERLGQGSNNPRHAEMAYDLMRYLLPGSRLILTDSFGWELREISADRLK